MDRSALVTFSDQLREARENALRDSESFDNIIHVVERLGSFLCGRITNLGDYKKKIQEHANNSALSDDIPTQRPDVHIPITLHISLALKRPTTQTWALFGTRCQLTSAGRSSGKTRSAPHTIQSKTSRKSGLRECTQMLAAAIQNRRANSPRLLCNGWFARQNSRDFEWIRIERLTFLEGNHRTWRLTHSQRISTSPFGVGGGSLSFGQDSPGRGAPGNLDEASPHELWASALDCTESESGRPCVGGAEAGR